ncbi:MAG TPA: HD domain-containing phosphohydrolase [Methylotenera sp.]|nr:HD domain-containing phosphohydrolase [Methylotenera sp.]HPH05966.1 HD domain-containing phosphohydrolase [Methylotenera sp.]HPN00544.1 HD domain-containing phosphohydrolase [Methylotenera sp.]
MQVSSRDYLLNRLERLNAIGVALSAERDNKRLLEMILFGAKEITNADSGTLYLLTDDKKHLKFEILSNSTLDVQLGGTTGQEIPLLPIPLYLADGSPNLTTVAAYATLESRAVNIKNAYEEKDFDFSGTRKYDEIVGYHSESFLTIPMKNHEDEIIGVLQLINAIDINTQKIIPFSDANQRLVESLASQAAVAMTNHSLIEGLKRLLEAFVKLIANAIDEKSPHTGGHCRRVPELTLMLAQAAIDTKIGPLKDFTLSDKEFYELTIAGWLHDCGKITTPESVMDKATKLSAIYDRIELIAQRYALVKKQAECDFQKKQIAALQSGAAIDVSKMTSELIDFYQQCDVDLAFLRRVNFGVEAMAAEDKQRVQDIAAMQYVNEKGQTVAFLTEDEAYNLQIHRGTLTKEERAIINNHISVSIDMLESLPYPKDFQRVPEYAGGHHERMDGKGYPRGLTGDEMSVPARVMAIADIFEALTSADRPYKKPKTLTESLNILGKMKLDNHIDPDLFDIFVREKIYLKYANVFLEPEQIDDVDHTKITGYQPDISQV